MASHADSFWHLSAWEGLSMYGGVLHFGRNLPQGKERYFKRKLFIVSVCPYEKKKRKEKRRRKKKNSTVRYDKNGNPNVFVISACNLKTVV